MIARELARRAGVPHAERSLEGSFLVEWLDHGVEITGGMVSCTQFHILSLADLLSGEADVVLDGLGGDALLGAHLKPAMIMAKRPGTAMAALYRQRATVFATDAERREIFSPDFLANEPYDPIDALREHFQTAASVSPWWGCHRFDLLERQRRFIQFGPHQLRPLLRVETPFYWKPLVDLATSLPLRFLFGQRAYLRMHARHLAELAAVRDTGRGLPLSSPFAVRFGKQVLDAVCRRARGDAGSRRAPASLRPPTTRAGFGMSCASCSRNGFAVQPRPRAACSGQALRSSYSASTSMVYETRRRGSLAF